ncbi:MAG: DUF3791 domain-containing protein [Fibromonadaceae bacterium]|jgi:hypothetical protein|nr:DUF3791 domain-containing protein [Fibromonadaceae bacterium]
MSEILKLPEGCVMADFGRKEMEFAVFCLESVAEKLGKPGNEVYKMLTEDSDILDDYIIPCYDVLHTQGKTYIVNDILDYMKEKGLVK